MSSLTGRPRRTLALAVGLGLMFGTACRSVHDDRPRISIEYGMYPELFEGHEVVIDGKVVGRLESVGRSTRTSFPVEPGVHEVHVRHPEYGALKARVVAELSGQKVRLLADLEDRAAEDGSLRTLIVLR